MNLTVDPNTNRVNMPGFRYDAAGNLTASPGASGPNAFSYDSENRLSVAEMGSITAMDPVASGCMTALTGISMGPVERTWKADAELNRRIEFVTPSPTNCTLRDGWCGRTAFR